MLVQLAYTTTTSNQTMKDVPLHVLRFYHPDNIASVHHMAYNSREKTMAVLERFWHQDQPSRFNIIKIWAATECCYPVVLKRIFVDASDHSLLENLAWAGNNRLFACTQDSRLIEFNLSSNLINNCVTVGGGVAWCIAVDKCGRNIAVGSDDGTISAFEIEDSGSISFGKVIGKCSNRVLSIVWAVNESNQSVVIAGSVDFITIWSHVKGSCIDKLNVKQGHIGDGLTVVWSLAVSGNCLISGDSQGFTSFWNLKTRASIKSFQSHEADVLTVASTSDGRAYSSGVDPKISSFLIHDSGVDMVHENTSHRHDVKSMVVGPCDVLMSAGNGPYLVQCPKNRKRTSICFRDLRTNIHVSDSCVMFTYLKSLELYELSLEIEPSKALEVRSKKPILSSSFNNFYVVYRTMDKLVILKRTRDRKSVQKIDHNFEDSPLTIDHLFLTNSSLLIVRDSEVLIMELPSGNITNQISLPGSVYHLFRVEDSVVFVFSSGNVIALNLETFQSIDLPPLSAFVVDHAVGPEGYFWFLLNDETILSYKLKSLLTSTIKVEERRHIKYQGMMFCRSSLLLYSSDFLISYDTKGYSVRSTNDSFKHIIAVCSDQDNSLGSIVLVELSDPQLNAILPPKFDGKTTQSFHK